MGEKRATVACPECGQQETFDRLARARTFIETHRSETGHEATWELHRLSPGVERAGDDAGVCGRPPCTTESSPLYLGDGTNIDDHTDPSDDTDTDDHTDPSDDTDTDDHTDTDD